MLKFFAIIALLIIVGSVSAQKRTIVMNNKYTNAKVVLIGKGTVPVRNLMLVNDTLLQYNSKSGDGSTNMKQVSASSVRYVKIKKGSYAGIGAIAGGGFGLLVMLDVVLSVKSDATLDDSNVNWAPYVVAVTAGGVLIGSLVGLCIPKWKTYFLPDKKTSFSIKFSPSISPSYCGLGMKMKF